MINSVYNTVYSYVVPTYMDKTTDIFLQNSYIIHFLSIIVAALGCLIRGRQQISVGRKTSHVVQIVFHFKKNTVFKLNN